MDLGVSGLASGFDWRGLVDQLMEVERAPQQQLRQEQLNLRNQNTAYGGLATQLGVLQNRVKDLADSSLFDRRITSLDDESIATATASGSAALGSYSIHISQLATAAVQKGSSNIGRSINPTSDVSGLVLSDASFATPITSGTFSVNGKQVTIESTDTLQDVFDRISTATSGAVTGSYDPLTDTMTLGSAGTIVLGSATDTSNFLSAAKLYNNGTGTIESAGTLGSLNLSETLANSNLATSVSDGGAGVGEFKINGVSIAFNASTDSLKNVIDRINASGAGVTASYDSVNDQMVLTNNKTGDLGIGLEDVTGNFLAATGLSGGALTRGKNLQYSINNGGTLVSESNTITEASSGLSGLSLTALKTGTVKVDVQVDSESIKKAINGFLEEYNKLQGMIDTETASSTDADGKVKAGVLAGESDVNEISRKLRGMVFSRVSGLGGVLDHLHQIGIDTNGDNNNLSLSDASALDSAIEKNLSSLRELFSDEERGVATDLDNYLESLVGDDGTLVERRETLTTRSSDIDDQIANMERLIQANRQAMIDSFIAMERAQANSNQQLQFLQQQLGG